MSAQENADLAANDAHRRMHTRTFNPFQIKENCFYVALGRLLALDSTTVASWTGNDERRTNNVGLDISSMANTSFTCMPIVRAEFGP